MKLEQFWKANGLHSCCVEDGNALMLVTQATTRICELGRAILQVTRGGLRTITENSLMGSRVRE